MPLFETLVCFLSILWCGGHFFPEYSGFFCFFFFFSLIPVKMPLCFCPLSSTSLGLRHFYIHGCIYVADAQGCMTSSCCSVSILHFFMYCRSTFLLSSLSLESINFSIKKSIGSFPPRPFWFPMLLPYCRVLWPSHSGAFQLCTVVQRFSKTFTAEGFSWE